LYESDKSLAFSLVPGSAYALAGQPPAHAQEGKTTAGRDESAMAAVKRDDFLSQQKQFSITIDIDLTSWDWGQKIEFGETCRMTVSRPDRFRVDTTDRDGSSVS
jgi:hypothetical protein